MARRGDNIYKRKDGRWEGRYKNGYTADGKTKYSSVYGKSYSFVKTLLDEKKAAILTNSVCLCSYTVSEIINLWLCDVKNKVKESTYSTYLMKVNKHILPHFFGMKYDALTVNSLNSFIAEKKKIGLSDRYIADIVLLIKSAAKFGQRNLGIANRIEYFTLPKLKNSAEKIMLSEQEKKILTKELTDNPSCSNAGILLAMSTGIRIGELCALRWTDIDLEKSKLTVRNTVQRITNENGKGTKLAIMSPKSTSSAREIPLPEFIIPLLKKIMPEKNGYFLSGNDKIIEPRTLQYRFAKLIKKLGITYVTFHSLRHRFATDCVAMGFDVKTLSEILGHSSVQVTLSLYVHSSMERKKCCMKIYSDNFICT